jgi:hypothetical protein
MGPWILDKIASSPKTRHRAPKAGRRANQRTSVNHSFGLHPVCRMGPKLGLHKGTLRRMSILNLNKGQSRPTAAQSDSNLAHLH